LALFENLQRYFTPENNYIFLRAQMALFLQKDAENRIPFIGIISVL
jgi:hypothetical protein